jgi:hypothetical protein
MRKLLQVISIWKPSEYRTCRIRVTLQSLSRLHPEQQQKKEKILNNPEHNGTNKPMSCLVPIYGMGRSFRQQHSPGRRKLSSSNN